MATIEGNRSRTETSLLQKVLKIARPQIGIFEIHGSLTKYVIERFSFASTLSWNLSKGEGLSNTDLQECIRPLYLNKPCFLYYGSRIGCRTFGKEKRILIWPWKSHVFHQPGKRQEMMFLPIPLFTLTERIAIIVYIWSLIPVFASYLMEVVLTVFVGHPFCDSTR